MNETAAEYLIGVRLREVGSPTTTDSWATSVASAVGDLVVVEAGGTELVGEVRRPRRPLPDFKRDRALPARSCAWPPRGRPGSGGSAGSARRRTP